MANYSRSDGKAVNLYVAYYTSQRKGLSPHSPSVCLPGGGWTLTNRRELRIGTQRVKAMTATQGADNMEVFYWLTGRLSPTDDNNNSRGTPAAFAAWPSATVVP